MALIDTIGRNGVSKFVPVELWVPDTCYASFVGHNFCHIKDMEDSGRNRFDARPKDLKIGSRYSLGM